jgi:hypothetical protein
MRGLALMGLALAFGASFALAEETVTFDGQEIVVVSVARVKEFRDLKVKDVKKQDLAVVVLELRWKGEKRQVLIQDKDLAVRDARGGNHDCALRFVQAVAAPDESPARLEIPFHVKADVALTGLRIGKASLAIASPASAPQP